MIDGRKARDPELLDQLDKLPRAIFESRVWRVVRESRDVLQASRVGARWDPGSFDVLYTSLNPEAAREEVYFHLSRQPVFPSVPFQIHRLRIRLKQILNLQETELLRGLGVDISNYANMDYSRTQAIADGAFFLGYSGIIVPSARFQGLNLVLFTDHIELTDVEVEHSEPVNWIAWRRSR